jgi:hypothetical protein
MYIVCSWIKEVQGRTNQSGRLSILLLVLVSTIILGTESCETCGHILRSRGSGSRAGLKPEELIAYFPSAMYLV